VEHLLRAPLPLLLVQAATIIVLSRLLGSHIARVSRR
jgi:hypothetical protein